ncbi:APC family permease [Dasania sp. GY-MA-18]|uniref:APC family permease n=1 Tax=Dasania phycosphaerae TaxID=2950436 RepID=A0A9J6RN46_9GAMM|nr:MULTISPECIES: APC family permease [Dasania]MCR8923151.1 APC family permease [Dasania sp. GY-MA-18]MCZ0865583.1 APC family permease [Dasania phycosphaerae]MCZ0869308.1 APC family permease [Dasania phycosphaerae]
MKQETIIKKDSFKRTLGFKALLAVAIGLVVSQGVMVIMLQGAGFAGLGFFIAMAIGYLLAVSYVFSFSELALMFPRAGTLSTYTEVAIGHFPAIVSVFSGYVVVAMFATSAELVLIDLLLEHLFPGLIPPYVVAFGMLLLFTLLNIKGVDIFAKLQSVLAYTMILFLLLIGGVASYGGIAEPQAGINLTENINPMGIGVLSLVALAVWGFVGAEFVCPLVEETKQPEKNVPRSMLAGVSIIFVIYILYCLGAMLFVPGETLASAALPHLEFVKAVFGEQGLVFLTVAAITATCSTVNTSLAAVPRMIYGMAHNGQTFSAFKTLHKKYQTPWIAIVFIAAVTGLPILIYGRNADAILLLLTGAAISWLVAYIIAHVDVIVLRYRLPNQSRPFKTPFYPLPQILGIAGMIYGIIYAAPSEELEFQIMMIAGSVLLIGCVLAALWVKLVMKRGLFEPSTVSEALND